MKIIGILGSPVKRGTNFLLEKALDTISKQDLKTELIHLVDYNLEFCQGCNRCLKEKSCVIDDDLTILGKKLTESDGVVLASPSYFGTPTATMKNFMDRTRYLKMQGHKLDGKVMSALSSSGLNQGGGQSTIEALNRFGLTHGMVIVGPAGIPQTEANIVVGTSETDDGWKRVKDDQKAIDLAENLGLRIAKLVKKLSE